MARKKRRKSSRARRAAKRRPVTRRRLAKSRRRPAARRKARSGESGGVVRGVLLGQVLSVTYKHAADGRTYRHTFPKGTPIGYTTDRKHLIIPARVAAFIR